MELVRDGYSEHRGHSDRGVSKRFGARLEMKAQPPVIVLVGELDFSVASALRDVLLTAGDSPIIDVSELSFIDAGIIGEFVRLAKRVAPRRPLLLRARPFLRRLVQLVDLEKVIAFSDYPVSGTIPRRVWNSPAA